VPDSVRSYCRICTSQCGILVDTDGDAVQRVRGDRDHPMSQGYTCAKGRALPVMHHHPRRIVRPLLRTDAPPRSGDPGALTPVSWEHCLDDLAARLRGILDRHGPAAVGVFFGSGLGMDAAGYRMAEALHHAIGTPARFSPLTIDGTAKTVTATLVGGFPGLKPVPDYADGRLFIYVGVNPVVSHGHTTAMPSPTTTLRELRDRAQLWVIDPRVSETARLASGHIAPRPGTDYAILAHIASELLRHGAPGTGGPPVTGLAELREAVAPYALEHAAGIAGIPPRQLAELTAAVRAAGRLAIETGTGITMAEQANVVQWLSWIIMILTDSMNRPGGTWFHPGFFRTYDTAPLPRIPPEAFFASGPPSRPDLPGFMGEWPCAALPSEIEAGNIRAVLNLGGGLLTAFPGEHAMRRALAKLDVLATIEIIENETTALSTHVLPTKDQLERADINLWDFLSPRVAGMYSPAVVAPAGMRRSAWWVLAGLGRRLGFEMPPAPDNDGPEDDDAMLAAQATYARAAFADLTASRYAEAGYDLPAPWVDEFITQAGGWRLAPAQLTAQLAALSPGEPGSLRLIPRRQKRHVNSQLTYLGDQPEVLLHPDDAAAAGLTDGAAVIVRSQAGELTATARVDPGMRRGAVSVPHGHSDANVNRLTSHLEADPLTGMARYSGLPVSVHPAAPPPGPPVALQPAQVQRQCSAFTLSSNRVTTSSD
jgi:anaerobic selenocysteine-containing dehydrogenase